MLLWLFHHDAREETNGSVLEMPMHIILEVHNLVKESQC